VREKTEIASVICKFVIIGAIHQLIGLKISAFKLSLKFVLELDLQPKLI